MSLHNHDFHALGSPCGLRLHAPDEVSARRACAAAEAEVRRIEEKFSRYRADSVVGRLNASAGDPSGLRVDAETASLLDIATTLHEQSDGRFDASSGVLRQVWDFRAGRLPSAEAVAGLLSCIGWERVRRECLPDGGEQVWLPAGMALDFGGFGKEYAADRAAAVLRAEGVRHGLVELGGDISVVGAQPDGSPWRIGIRHPRDPARAIASIAVSQGGLATSGDYERCLLIDGRRYSHILDARTGWPVMDGPVSLSVAAPSCLLAGAVCTLGLLQGAQAMDWLADCPQPWLAIDADLHLQGALAPVELA